MISVTMDITAGLPFARQYVVTLPTGRSWWTSLLEFEVLAQIRENNTRTSRLVKDLSEHIFVTMPSSDEINVLLSMTGLDTRLITKSGYYDLLMSDTGTTDGRAYVICKGRVKYSSVITAEMEGL